MPSADFTAASQHLPVPSLTYPMSSLGSKQLILVRIYGIVIVSRYSREFVSIG
jgi:hypothetical protein